MKPEFWKHEALSELPEATHMLACALLNYADDYGFFNANPRLIQSELFPLREPSVSIPESLRSLQAIGYIRLGNCSDGRRYGEVVNFCIHQRVSHPTDSKIKDLSITWEHSGNSPEPLRNPPETFRPEGNREGKGKEQGIERDARANGAGEVQATTTPSRTTIPRDWKPDEAIKQFAALKCIPAAELAEQAELFVNHHLGKADVSADWNASFRSWLGRRRQFERRGDPVPEKPGFKAYVP